MQQEVKKKSKTIAISLLIAFCVILCVGGVIFAAAKFSEYRRQETAQNPLSISEVEEDLEWVFMSLSVNVYDVSYEYDVIYYYVEDGETGNKYKVRYKIISSDYLFYYKWSYDSHIQISFGG